MVFKQEPNSKSGVGDGAVRNTALQIAIVASRASVVSVVGGSNPDMGAFFCFLSEKCTFRQKRTNRGILYNKAHLVLQRGHGWSGITAKKPGVCYHLLS